MPEWFRKLKPNDPNPKTTIKDPGTAKRCVPVLDAVSQGFIIPLWCDLHIKVAKSIKLFDDKDVQLSKILDNGVLDSELVGQTISDIAGNPVVATFSCTSCSSLLLEPQTHRRARNCRRTSSASYPGSSEPI